MPQQKKYDWNRLYDEFLSGGMTRSDFAKVNKISVNMIYKNFKTIEKRKAVSNDMNSVTEEPDFVKVRLEDKDEIHKHTELTLEFKDFSIHVCENTDLNFLSEIIKKVLPLC